MSFDALMIGRCLACGFFAVLFIQSGIDKVVDYKGNLAWLTPHFANSPFKSSVPILLRMLTVLELMSGVMAAIAIVGIMVKGQPWLPAAAICLCGFTLVCLFAGQRIAKDYAGAASLAAYFSAFLIALFLIAGV